MVVAGGDAQVEAHLRRASIDHRPFTTNGALFATRCTQALLDTVHQRNIGMVHVHGHGLGLTGKTFAAAANVPLVMTVEELPEGNGFLSRRAARKHLAGRPIITRSAYAAEVLRRDFAVPGEALRVIPPAVDPLAFEAASVTAERTIKLASTWGLVDDARPVVLVPDAQSDPAWLNVLIEAAMSSHAPDAVWVLIGAEDQTESVTARFAEQGALSRLRWVPEDTDWTAAYKLSSVVICLPRSVPGATPPLQEHSLEAQAMGRAVITSDFAAGPETIQPGKTGWLTRHRDAGSLSYAVSAALDREDVVRDAMALAARAHIAENFSPHALQSATLAVYAEVAGSNAAH